jgi:site-specific DNA recombinase
MTGAAVYRRVSTDRQEREGYSLEDQDRRGHQLADANGLDVSQVYTDVLSGADPERPEYRRMLADATAGKFGAVLVVALDRFGRDALETKIAMATLDAAGVRIISATEEIDRETADGRFMVAIRAELAELERHKIKARTRAGISARARAGIPWGVPGMGYTTGENGHWVIEEGERKIVELLSRRRTQDGLSYHGIARAMNLDGIPSRAGTRWGATAVRRIIESKHVRGYFRHGGEWHKGRHEPIVGEQTWELAQAMIGRDAQFTPSSPGRRPARHLFVGGHLRCAHCGQAMLARKDRYVCATARSDGAGACLNGWHSRTDVDSRFLSLFEAEFLDFNATRERVAAELDRTIGDVGAQVAAAESELARIERQRQRVEADYLAEELGAVAYERLSAKLDEEYRAALAACRRLTEHEERVRSDRAGLDAESETLRRLSALRDTVASCARDALAQQDLAALRGVVAAAFRHVYLDRDGRITGMAPGVALQAHPILMDGVRVDAEVDDAGYLKQPDRLPIPFATNGADRGVGA